MTARFYCESCFKVET